MERSSKVRDGDSVGRMVALPTPTNACGAWTLNLEVAGLDTSTIGLGGSGPFALVVTAYTATSRTSG